MAQSENEPASTRRINAAAKLLAEPTEAPRVVNKLENESLTNLAALVRQEQSERAVARGDLSEIVAQAFETGFGRDGLGLRPWVEGNIIICPGALIWSSRTSHVCRFASVNNTWIWDCHELISEEKRSTPGARDGFRAIGLVPALDGLEIDLVSGKARSGLHSAERVISFEVRQGELIEVSQRSIRSTGMK